MNLYILLIYTFVLSILVFRVGIVLSVFFIIVNVFLQIYFHLSYPDIVRPFRRAVPFLLIIFFTSVFFSGGNEGIVILSTTWFSISLSLKGFYVGLSAVVSFLAIISVGGLFRIKSIDKKLLNLSERHYFIRPLVLTQRSFFESGKGKQKNKKKKNHEKNKLDLNRIFLRIVEEIEKYKGTFGKQNKNLDHNLMYITSVTAILFSTKLVRILPGIPFASGQKLIIIIPLLFFVSVKCGKLAATITAFNFSLLVFIFSGGGQLGIFDIFRMVLLGLCVDLSVKLLPENRKLRLGFLVFVSGILGFLFGVFAASLAVALNVPDFVYLLFGPRIISNSIFGCLGGLIAFKLLDVKKHSL